MLFFNVLLSLFLGVGGADLKSPTPRLLLQEFKNLTLAERYDDAIIVADKINLKKLEIGDRHVFSFYKACANHAIGDKKKTLEAIKEFDEAFGYPPKREQAVIALIKNDLEVMKDNKFDPIARKMKRAAARLQNSYGGPVTQKIQKDIVADLDKLIKEAEDAKDKQEKQGEGQEGDQDKKDPKGSSSKGLKDSRQGKDSGPGKVDEKKMTKLGQQWGSLPPKDRAKALQDITRDMPAKHRQMIEEYFKRISRSENDK